MYGQQHIKICTAAVSIFPKRFGKMLGNGGTQTISFMCLQKNIESCGVRGERWTRNEPAFVKSLPSKHSIPPITVRLAT